MVGVWVGAFVGAFVGALVAFVGALVGAFVGALVGALVGAFVEPPGVHHMRDRGGNVARKAEGGRKQTVKNIYNAQNPKVRTVVG